MQVLDVANTFPHWGYPSDLQPNFVCLCTLLPYTRALRELRVKIRQTRELIWLAYAVFHPRTRLTRWDTLVIHGELEDVLAKRNGLAAHWQRDPPQRAVVSWEAIGWVASDANVLSTLLAMDPSGDNYHQLARDTNAGSRVWESAVVSKRSTVRTLDGTKPLVAVPSGQVVELCDGSIGGSDDVRVLVPGYGFGWIPVSTLSATERTTPDTFPLKSHIRVLHMTGVEMPPGARMLWLELFSESVVHFRGSDPNWYRSDDIDWLAPRLLSVDCWAFNTETAEAFAMLTSVETLGVMCSWRDLPACIEQLTTLPKLRHLRITIDELNREARYVIVDRVRSLVTRKRSLRRLLIATLATHNFRWSGEWLDFTELQGTRDLARRKLALLSVVRSAVGHPASRLDACVLSVVFALCATSLELIGHYSSDTHDDSAVRVPSPRHLTSEGTDSWCD